MRLPPFADVVYIGSGLNAMVHAVNINNGAQLWNASLFAPIFANPTVASGRVLVSDWSYGAGRVYVFATR